jgi:predicted alpha/beta superfamily hydrolase
MTDSRAIGFFTSGALAAALLAGCASAPVRQEAPAAAAVEPATLPKVSFPDSAVHELPSASGRRYQVWVDLPASYAGGSAALPVVVVTDPTWAFPMVRSIRNLTGRRGRNIEDFILVGLTHDPTLTTGQSRARDYTPTDPRRSPSHDPTDYDFPPTARRKRTATTSRPGSSPHRRQLPRRHAAGDLHRPFYGGLFGAYVLLTKPGLFRNYILGSPSLWFDRHSIFGVEVEHGDRLRTAEANVFMLTGGYETVRPEPLYEKKHDLVADMRRLEQTLRSRDIPACPLVGGRRVARPPAGLPDVVTRGLLKLTARHGAIRRRLERAGRTPERIMNEY